MRNNRGFSLVEILVVMAISVILTGLVLYPVVQSFKLTRQAQTMIDAQDAVRQGMEQVSRELGEAMMVFDNSVANVTIFDPPGGAWDSGQQSPIQLPVRQPDGSIEWFTIPFGKIDFILPRITMHCNNPEHTDGEPRDYPRGDDAWPPCPVCKSTDVSANPKMPLEAESTIVRYFLGLRYNDPDVTTTPPPGGGIFGWRSPWEGQVDVGDENQVVLYRVEFDPTDNSLFPEGMSVTQRIDDPVFFYRAGYCTEWMRRARVVGIGRYQDLVKGEFGPSGDCTAIEPSVTFKFQAVNNDTFAGAWSADRNFEYPNAVPSVYTGAYGYWIENNPDIPPAEREDPARYNYAVTIYRDENTLCYYTRFDSSGDFLVQRRTYSGSSWSTPTTTFNISEYLATQVIPPTTEMAFTVDLVRGQVNFALHPARVSNDIPPNAVCALSPVLINTAFHDVYSAPVHADRGSARRLAYLAHFDRSNPGLWLKNARVVPGSERVDGPDMYPGGGAKVRYERVPLALGNPGLNQYKIDYDTGRIEFSSDPGQNIPDTGPILVDYRVQFNRNGDIVKGDYTTKSLVTIHMAIRMFDPESAKPHVVDVTNSVKVRNAHR